jgi:hypothetical protein
VAHTEDKRNAYRILVGKISRQTTCKTGCRWEENIKMSLKGIELKGMDWIHVVQDWDK